jgi:DNA-binding NtrC family response regulator
MQPEMDEAMGNKVQTILVVSDDAALCAATREEFEASISGLRVASVTSVAAARRILEDGSPAVILLEEAAIEPEADGPQGIVPRLDAVVTSLALYAPVVVIGTSEPCVELSELLDAGAADYVMRDGGWETRNSSWRKFTGKTTASCRTEENSGSRPLPSWPCACGKPCAG